MFRAVLLVMALVLGLGLATSRDLAAQEPDTSAAPSDGPEKLNPYTGDEEAIAEGKALYMKYNCYGCHGTEGGGGMGSSITDAVWAFGGDDENVYRTIKEGRGRMPDQFGSILSEDEIWKMIAFMRSLYKGDPSTVVW